MAPKDPNFYSASREPTELQMARWDDDGGNQFMYADIFFVHGKMFFGRTAHLQQVILKYWQRLSEPQLSSAAELSL